MNTPKKTWVQCSVTVSILALVCCALLLTKYGVLAEIAAAKMTIVFSEKVCGKQSERTILWMYAINEYMRAHADRKYDSATSEYLISLAKDALNRCMESSEVSDTAFGDSMIALLRADRIYQPSKYLEDMDYVYELMVDKRGKDSSMPIYIYPDDTQNILNCLAAGYLGEENDRNIVYSQEKAFEAFRIGKMYNEPQSQLVACELLIRIGEYYLTHGNNEKALQHYVKVLHCIPAEWPEIEEQKRAIVLDRIETAKHTAPDNRPCRRS